MGPNDKLLRRFYEPLILLSVLEPTRGALRPDLITDRGLQGRAKLWRNFLDQLCFLCDAQKGGDTVTAIGAQRTVEHTVFWLGSNSGARNDAKRHVEWILSQLARLYELDRDETSEFEDKLIAECVKFSSCRVKTYIKFLLNDIKKSQPKKIVEGSEDKQLFKALGVFEQHRNDLRAFCTYAYEFRRTEAVHILTKRHVTHEARGQWSDIRHNIGKLGCWHKAIKTLLQAAQTFPQQLEGATVSLVYPRGPSETPTERSKILDLDFKSIVNRMLKADQQTLADKLVQSLNELNMVLPLKQQFKEVYSEFQPRPHAELLVLEKFFELSFDFVHDDRYIGCSKPSCYCCNLYMKVHPGQFEQRACHGNLWPNWGPPIPLSVISSPQTQNRLTSRPQDHHTFKMLQDMLPNIRTDVQEQIQSRQPRRARLPDSTTGMSSVVVDINLNRVIDIQMGEPSGRIVPENKLVVAKVEHNLGSRKAEDDHFGHEHAELVADQQNDLLSIIPQVETSLKVSDTDGEAETPLSTIVEDSSGEDDDDDGGVLLFSGRANREARYAGNSSTKIS